MTQFEFDFDEPRTAFTSWDTTDYSKFTWNMTNSNLSVGTIKPTYIMQFSKEGKTVGTLDWNGSEMVFQGNLAPSTRVFFDYLAQCFQQRLQQEYTNGYQDGQIKTSL
jgi:hypothetical protein